MRITLPSGAEAEFERPAEAPDMGLVVAPDLGGLRPLFDQMVGRMCSVWNMSTIAVDPFPGHDLGDDVDARKAAISTLSDADVLRNLEEAAEATGCDTVGLIGFCMGGMHAFKSCVSDRFARIVSFYGMIRVPDAWRSPTGREPLDLLAEGHANRVLAIIGDLDSYTPPDDVAALEATAVTVVRYPEAEHGFVHDPLRPVHRSDDAADALERAETWLRAAVS